MALDEVINNISEGAQAKARELSAEAEKERAAILRQATTRSPPRGWPSRKSWRSP